VAAEVGASTSTRGGVTPGDGLLHPLALAAVALLILNDQILKSTWPGPVTGKLSDVAGLIVAPLALQAASEVGLAVASRWKGPSWRVLLASIAIVGLAFTSIQLWPPAVELYKSGLGAAQWPFRAIAALLTGQSMPAVMPVAATPDAADLLALPALGLAWWVGRRRSGRRIGLCGRSVADR
jgi:hypothetical protein